MNSVSLRALGTSSALCFPHVSLRNVQTDSRTDSHACMRASRQTAGKEVIKRTKDGLRERGRGKR